MRQYVVRMAIELYRHYRPWMAMHGAMAMAGYPIMAIADMAMAWGII